MGDNSRRRRLAVWPRALALGVALASGVSCAAGIEWSQPKPLSRGVTVRQANVTEPRTIRYIAVCVDLKTPGLFLVGADRDPDFGKPMAENPGLYLKNPDGTLKKIEPAVIRTRREPVRTYMTRAVTGVKEGGRGLDMALAFISAPTSLPYDPTHANPNGLFISEGKVVTERGRPTPLLVVRKDGTAAIVDELSPSEYPNVQVANSGATHIRKDGQDIVPAGRNTPGARVAIGVSKEGRYLWILAADDGRSVTYNTGATYHDLNDAFASLDVPNAFNTGSGGESAICVRDLKTGVIRMLNIGSDGREPGNCCAAIGVCYRSADPPATPTAVKPSVPAASVAAEKKPVPAPAPAPEPAPEQISARFASARLAVSRDRSSGETALRGLVRVTANSDLQRFKRPVLYVASLFDVDGMWQMHDVTCTDQKTYRGHLLDRGQTPAQVSKWQPEVGKEAWASIVFGDAKRGFFTGYRIPDRAKLLGYRLELWQNGGLVDSYDSDRTGLRRLDVPDDWFVKGKYSGKIVYRWPPKEK